MRSASSPSIHADVTGTVTLKGQPNSKDETFVAKVANCGESSVRHTENWKVGSKGELAEVVVWIVNPKAKSPLAQPAGYAQPFIKQILCRYEPHVAVVVAGKPIEISNLDPALHNIHARKYDGLGKPPGADVFNFGQAQGQKEKRQFDQPGIYTLECNVHSWMQSWIMVLPKGDADLACFAVSQADGTFKLCDSDLLADGDYKIDAWHPRFAQPLEQTLHVKNGMAVINFQFDGAKSF